MEFIFIKLIRNRTFCAPNVLIITKSLDVRVPQLFCFIGLNSILLLVLHVMQFYVGNYNIQDLVFNSLTNIS